MSLNALSSKYMFRRSCNMLCCSLAPHTNEQKRSQCSRLPSVSSGGGPSFNQVLSLRFNLLTGRGDQSMHAYASSEGHT